MHTPRDTPFVDLFLNLSVDAVTLEAKSVKDLGPDLS